MIATIVTLLWLGVITIISVGGFYKIYKTIKETIDRDYKYSINFDEVGFSKGNYPVVKFKIRNKYKYFLLDSGAGGNIIAKEALSSIMSNSDTIKIVDKGIITGVGGGEEVTPIIEEQISIGRDKFIETFRITDTMGDVRKLMKETSGLDIIGVIGSEFFNKSKWVLDFDNLVIWVKK